MLRFVSIDDFALIDHLEVEFERGLNLITGETGSGKSILVDAVGLLIGARASQEMVRQGRETARIEGVFSLEEGNPVRTLLGESGFSDDGPELLVRRDISLTGSNRVFVNGRLATLSLLGNIGRYLVDIHGQHSQQQLLTAGSHLEFLDRFAQAEPQRGEVAEAFRQLNRVRQEIESIRQAEKHRLQRIDLLRYQIAEIDRLKLRIGLDEELETEKRMLATAERRTQLGQEAYQRLYDSDESTLGALERCARHLTELADLDPPVIPLLTRLREAQYAVEEVALQLRDYLGRIEFDAARLEQVQEALAEIDRAKRKYGPSLAEVLVLREAAGEELFRLEHQEAEIERLVREETRLAASYARAAGDLSQLRRGAADELAERVENELAELGMRDTRFRAQLRTLEGVILEQGIDEAEFLISPNPGEELKPLIRIASGGELSRVMLALKAVLKADGGAQTLVFDEVDSGIGGRIATTLGEKLSRVARRHQVFCVTHLPQIAAFADQHLHVGKEVHGGRTLIQIHVLDEEARVEELSRMLAGEKTSETTRRHARELLQSCRRS